MEEKLESVEITILGNLQIIGYFDGFNLVKVTTRDGTALNVDDTIFEYNLYKKKRELNVKTNS